MKQNIRISDDGTVPIAVFTSPLFWMIVGLLTIIIAINIYAVEPGISYVGLGLLLAGIGGLVTIAKKTGSISCLAGTAFLYAGFIGF